jgi:single-stranded-DNA-specific exonuclease
MQSIQKKWQIDSAIDPLADKELCDYHPFLRQILYNRGYTTVESAQKYLSASPPDDLNPYHLFGMEEAVSIINFALKNNQKIVIYGDYDVDGVTATALLVECLTILGAQVRGYIPNRFDDGYGLNREALDSIKNDGEKIVITVDCGIRSIEEVDHAKKLGLEVIITDHHHPLENLPLASALIDPKLPFDTYPDKNLAGVGVAYKLAYALIDSQLRQTHNPLSDSNGKDGFYQFGLDLVTLGTVADLASLIGENRTMVRHGIALMNRPQRPGIKSLIEISGISERPLIAHDIGYILGPRLNAAGRLDSALAALELLLTKDPYSAGQLAQLLDNQNRDRQHITQDQFVLAETIFSERIFESQLIFTAHPDFNSGIIGLVASRLVDKYYKPAFVAKIGEEFTRGSCRSIPEFHITDALDRCTDLMEHHGGHAAAAGFTVKNKNLDELIKRLSSIAEECLSGFELRPTLCADLEIPLNQLKPDLLPLLESLEPIGYGNQGALFVSRDLKITRARTIGSEEAHLKLTLTDGIVTYDAIAFRLGHWIDHLPARIDILYSFEKNIFNNRTYLQLNIKDIHPTLSTN